MIQRFAILFILLLASPLALAQSGPHWPYGYTPSEGAWEAEWENKVDYSSNAVYLNPCTQTRSGLVPTPPDDPAKFLNGQCIWAIPPSSGLFIPNSILIGGNGTSLTTPSAASATAFLNAFTGDSGNGGVKGLVPAPSVGDAAAGKVLGAGGGWVAGGSVASLATTSANLILAGTGSGPFTGAVTVNSTLPTRSQAGGNIAAGDGGGLVYNTGGTGATLPVHTTTGFGAGFATDFLTDGTAATLAITTDTCNGNATEPLGIKQGMTIIGDGTSTYKCILGIPEPVASSVLVASSGRVPAWQAGTSSQYVRGNGSVDQSAAFTSGTLADITAFGLRDASAAFDLTLAGNSSTALTAGRTLTFDVVNAARTVKLGSNLTIASDPGAVTGATKSNGSGTFAQAACADLSNAVASCSTLPTIPQAITWVPGINPNGASIFRASATRTITAIVCRPEVAAGGTATIAVYKAPSGTAISAGTILHSGTCNANGTAATDQTLTLVGGATDNLASGDTVGIVTTGTTVWTSSGAALGAVTVYIQ